MEGYLRISFWGELPDDPVHPARFVPQYPMGADGHGSAGLLEISEDCVPRVF
jgi:hypothetical protein